MPCTTSVTSPTLNYIHVDDDIMTHNVLFYENIAVAGTLLIASLPMFISMCTLPCRINGSVGNENSHDGVDSFCSCLVYSKR